MFRPNVLIIKIYCSVTGLEKQLISDVLFAIFVFRFGKDEELNIILKNDEIVTGRCYPDGSNRVVLTFDGDVPTAGQLVDFKLANDVGNVFGIYSGYGTVYQTIENGYILSNDGSVYVPPAEPDPEPVYEPTLDELKTSKKSEVSAACEQTIARGVDVQLPGGVEHFSLTANDQINPDREPSRGYCGRTADCVS